MNAFEKVKEHLSKGLVLDDRGQWVPLSERLTCEKSFREHLAKGEVLVDGEWVALDRALASSKRRGT